MTIDPLALKRRHPLCPECGYDLVGTVESGGRTCPECGFAFTPADLVHEVRSGDWTPLRGLRRLAIAIVLRSLVLIPLLTLVLMALSPLLNIAIRGGRYAVAAVIVFLFIPGVIVGQALARKAVELMGCVTILIHVTIAAAALVVSLAAVRIALIWVSFSGYEGMIAYMTAITAAFWAVRVVVHDS